MSITPDQLREAGLLHAETIAMVISEAKQRVPLAVAKTALLNAEDLLELAVKVVTADSDDQQEAINELESFLR